MRKKRTFLLLLLFVLLLICTGGCWNRRELNELAIAVAVGIDKAGDQFRVSVQVVDPGEVAARQGGKNRTPVAVYHTSGRTILEAQRKLTTVVPREIYASHLRMLVIGEEIAKEGIGDILDYFSRYHEHRTDFFIVVARDTKAENALKVLSHIEAIPANKMYSSLRTSEKIWAPTAAITLDKLLNDIVSEGKQPVITGLRLEGDQEPQGSTANVEQVDPLTRLQYLGFAVFKDDKLVGWLNEDESKVYNYLLDNVENTVAVLSCPQGGKLTIEIIDTKTKVKGKLQGGLPQADVHIQMEASIGEVECYIDLTDTKSIEKMETIAEEGLQHFVEQTIERVKKQFKIDIFGFGEAVHRSEPAYWKTVKSKWDQQFVQLPVNVKVDVKLRRLGTKNNSFLEELKKLKARRSEEE